VQLTRTAPLAQSDTATQQALDQAKNDVAAARPDVAEAQAKCCACSGPDLAHFVRRRQCSICACFLRVSRPARPTQLTRVQVAEAAVLRRVRHQE